MLRLMNIYEFFACFSKLPVRIEPIEEQLCDMGIVASIRYHEVDTDPRDLAGLCRVFSTKPPYAPQPIRHAHIIYSQHLPMPWRRLVVCKELLHLLDDDDEAARTREQVSRLIDEIVVPRPLEASLAARSDRFGLLNALKILLPRDALAELTKLHDEGRTNAQFIASAAEIPLPFAELALTPLWKEIVNGIK